MSSFADISWSDITQDRSELDTLISLHAHNRETIIIKPSDKALTDPNVLAELCKVIEDLHEVPGSDKFRIVIDLEDYRYFPNLASRSLRDCLLGVMGTSPNLHIANVADSIRDAHRFGSELVKSHVHLQLEDAIGDTRPETDIESNSLALSVSSFLRGRMADRAKNEVDAASSQSDPLIPTHQGPLFSSKFQDGFRIACCQAAFVPEDELLASRFGSELRDEVALSERGIIIDLNGTLLTDLSIGSLVHGQYEAKKRGLQFGVICQEESVTCRAIRHKLHNTIPIFASEETALDELGRN
jgi:hypothetical protein